jgi:hypothetical protein
VVQPPSGVPSTETVSLYPVSFDVWVETRGWEVSFTAGLAFSTLADKRYYLNGMGTADTTDDRIQRDTAAEDSYRPDIMALANVRYPQRFAGIGIAFGLGTDGSEQRYFLGPSYVFGKNFIFTVGWTGGRVLSLPTGQGEDKPPINGANTLDGVQSRFASGFYAGVGFTFAPRKDVFLDALTASTSVTGPPNAPPTIAAIPDQSILSGASTPAIAFSVDDDRTKPEVLTLSASSNDAQNVLVESIELGGTGSARTVKVTSKKGASGTAEITITADDGSAKASRTFKVTVNSPPTIDDVGSQSATAGQATHIEIKVGDKETTAERLVVTATSDKPDLVPAGAIVVGAGAENRTLTITPVAGQTGATRITIAVADEGGATASDTFTLTVNEP